MEKKDNFCSWCLITFGSAEPRRHRIVGNSEGGLEEKSYHFSCLHLLELKELILKEAQKEVERSEKRNVNVRLDFNE